MSGEGASSSYRTLYDSKEFSLGVQTDYDVTAQGLFNNCKNPSHVIIRSDATITVRFNSITNDSITINANTAFEMDLQFYAMFITTIGASNIKVIFTEVK